ncbi:sigma-70 family RNA polymerase sigma factor [Alicyclobacillus fastidiosus]|uniref:Sigma-70 family RNA polymerase sigma factor n=1 Tax=Alicyclobacillus fastidiosus TaxID=392011 RepID=A0ABY6ZC83_9BACL|nr:sigma-70 family RNA polymerase sigma factor [Alicyclobacillus fastidiosus]WAH40345.1 sigma-70 family RNA polymerase sigma factor [Alicyclobacillus fastidiosus]GMA61729.1 RNA polymerase sigma factor [Alicyclobacillus fastidiosus]
MWVHVMAWLTPDEAALSLFDEYADKIYEFAKYSLGNQSDAEDLVQEVFLRVYRTWSKRPADNPSAWVWTIARNCVRDVYRRRARHKEQPTDDLETWTHCARGPDTLVEVEDLFRALTQSERQVVYLRLIDDQSTEAAAEILNWSSAKVRVTLHRAVKKLRVMLSGDTAGAVSQSKERRSSR